MNSRDFRTDPGQPDDVASNHGKETLRYSVVADWYDAVLMDVADLSGEIAGRRVVAFADDAQQVIDYAPGDMQASLPGTAGFLFSGDDGDSLWFWPESEEIAFRFEPETGRVLRQSLSEGISRLVNQGALVFCHKVESATQGELPIKFPDFKQNAA